MLGRMKKDRLIESRIQSYSVSAVFGLSRAPAVGFLTLHGSVSVVSVCLSVCPVRALTFERLFLETAFLISQYPLECLGLIRISRSSGQGHGHRSKIVCLCVLFGL